MSQENVEIVRRAYALLGDLSSARRREHDDLFVDYFSDDAVEPRQRAPMLIPFLCAPQRLRGG
jgi:hypothetical protein